MNPSVYGVHGTAGGVCDWVLDVFDEEGTPPTDDGRFDQEQAVPCDVPRSTKLQPRSAWFGSRGIGLCARARRHEDDRSRERQVVVPVHGAPPLWVEAAALTGGCVLSVPLGSTSPTAVYVEHPDILGGERLSRARETQTDRCSAGSCEAARRRHDRAAMRSASPPRDARCRWSRRRVVVVSAAFWWAFGEAK